MADGEILRNLVDNLVEVLESRTTGSDPLRTPKASVNINRFFELVGKAIEQQQAYEGSAQTIAFTEDWPGEEDNIQEERITYSVIERKPGTFEAKPIGRAMSDRNLRQYSKFFRESKDDPDFPGCKIFTYGQWFDNLVEFKVWARTNRVASFRALWLEETLDRWEWYLKASGVGQFVFHERVADTVLSPSNKRIACRTLRFYVRTERLTVIREHILRSLVVEGQNP
jgi:hypothetical protein